MYSTLYSTFGHVLYLNFQLLIFLMFNRDVAVGRAEENNLILKIIEGALRVVRALFELAEQRALLDLVVPVVLLQELVRRNKNRIPFAGADLQALLKDIQQARRAAEKRRNLMRYKGAGAAGEGSVTKTSEGLGAALAGSFRNFPVFPSLAELQPNYKPLLRANLTKGKYPTLDEYLDVQFRLFREDLVAPLRNGIREFLAEFSASSTGTVERGIGEFREFRVKKKLTDISIYFDVRVVSAVCEDEDGLLHRLRFSLDGLKHVRWANSKRLLYGSLVCLSSDAFRTVLFATIFDRSLLESQVPSKKHKTAALAQRSNNRVSNPQADSEFGFILVRFERGNEEQLVQISDLCEDESFTMIEASGYFEAYRHTLQRILALRPGDLPHHERYIVQCANDIRPPAYLTRGTYVATLDLRLMLPKGVHNRKRAAAALGAVRVLEPLERWPSAASLRLEEAQRAALTQELALIVGPPGTGKTFLGTCISFDLCLHTRYSLHLFCYLQKLGFLGACDS